MSVNTTVNPAATDAGDEAQDKPRQRIFSRRRVTVWTGLFSALAAAVVALSGNGGSGIEVSAAGCSFWDLTCPRAIENPDTQAKLVKGAQAALGPH